MSETRESRGENRARFEVEVGTFEEFVNLLQAREGERGSPSGAHGGLLAAEPLPRRSVFVSQLADYRGTRLGEPMVRRYVVASFAYGADLVSFEEQVSHDLEFRRGPSPYPDGVRTPRKRHAEAFERLREDVRERIGAVGLEPHVPVLAGHLRHPPDPRAATDEGGR